MQTIRIAAGSVIVLFFSAIALSSAPAQTVTSGAPGNPLQLLKIVEQPNKAKGKSHASSLARSSAKVTAKIAAKTTVKTTVKTTAKAKTRTRTAAGKQIKSHGIVAQAKQAPSPTPVAPAPASASIWPTVNSVPLAQVATADLAAQPAAASAEPVLGEIVISGQTVHVASPDEVNDLDLAAGDHAAKADSIAPENTARETPAMTEAAPALHQGDVGNTSWILQVLAALGGAVAAGSAAWFLIGSAPQRTYG